MPTLTIEGQRVKVDDAFMQLSPEQQAATVDEIAGQLGISSGGGNAYKDGLSNLSKLTQDAAGGHSPDDRISANMEATNIERVMGTSPIQDAVIDPLMGWGDEVYSAGKALLGAPYRAMTGGRGIADDYKHSQMVNQEMENRRRERSPVASMAGDIAGAGMTGGAALKGGASLIGRSANSGLAVRALAGAGESAAYGGVWGAGAAEQGQKTAGALRGAATGAVAGAAFPIIGAGLRAGGNALAASARPFVASKKAAERKVADAYLADKGVEALQAGDAAKALRNGQPVLNVDRGGESVRSLARAASNSSPETRGRFQRFLDDRFSGQGTRATNFLQKMLGTNADDLTLKEGVEKAARTANKTNYDKAYAFNFGKNHPVELDDFMPAIPAEAVRDAQRIAQAERRPFGEQLIASIDDVSNTVKFSRQPSMREWDYIQRGLRSAADKGYRTGSGVGPAYKNLRKELLDVLDNANPYFKKARASAAQAFGAEDAIDAGRKFATSMRNTPEMAAALKGMSAADKKGFAVAYVSGLTRKIESSNDRVNVIRNLFGTTEARNKNVLALGKAGAAELEAFVRIETALDQMRGAMGNSTTARQLKEMIGIGALSGGYGVATGDWQTAALGVGSGVARFGAQKAGEKAATSMMKHIAVLLLSDNPAAIKRVIQNASVSPKYADALRVVTEKITQMSGVSVMATKGQPVTAQ